MRGVLTLALERIALSRGTVPSAVPAGQPLELGTNGTSGTRGTLGTVSVVLIDGEPIDPAALAERASLSADGVPAHYLDAWAFLQCRHPPLAAESDWRRAINDAGLFLDAWGHQAAALQWTSTDLFDPESGLVWRLAGTQVAALGADVACLADGRLIKRQKLQG